nr:hypothetical protein [Tanacetum cinerariifolium]
MYEEYFNKGNKSVSKSFALSNNLQQQDTQSKLNVQPTLEPIIPPTNVNAEEFNNDRVENASFEAYKFINVAPLGTKAAESSSSNVDTSNMHTFYQRCLARDPELKNIKEEMANHHEMDKCDNISTPMATSPKLDADLCGTPVDQANYSSMIESLMYLTSSRPELVQTDSGFELTSFSDADHTSCLDTRKSTSRGIQFLGDKLDGWMSKKKDRTAMSTAKA